MAAPDSTPDPTLDALRAALGAQYTVERLLGRGGMGSVYLARDVTLDRPVAIKVINAEVASNATLRDRFLQEARTVAKLRHPNIVPVFAAGDANGMLYFVMEFVPGESLRELLAREGKLSGDRPEHILRSMSLALDSAHALGMVHRDVKPENILIDRDTGRAMLTDFGVARAFEQDGGLTQTGMILGSPRYMSPEQASGDKAIDGRSDLYALALIGYEMYAGAPVVQSATASGMLVKHLTETPAPLGTKMPGVPLHVAAAIDRGLVKDPARRIQTGREFAEALAGQALTPTGEVRGMSAPSTRARRIPVVAIIAAVAAVAVALGVSVLRGGKSGHGYLVAPFEIQSGDPSVTWLRDGSVNMLTLTLGQWGDLQVVDYERTLSLVDKAGLGDKPRLSLDDAMRLAKNAGAAQVVTGQLQTIHDSLIVVARLYDVQSGKSKNQASDATTMGADPRPVFDRIAQKLLSIAGGPTSTMQLSQATTTSLEAYRAYLAGLKRLNSWDLIGADSFFARAIDIDSAFALAYHKRSLALGWGEGTGRPEYLLAADRAYALAGRLPPRERALVQGHYFLSHALADQATDTLKAQGEFTASIKAYSDLFARGDTLVAEAWYGQADAYYHGRLVTGSNERLADYTTRSLRGFNKTLAIDSSFHLAYSHLVQIYNSAAAQSSVLVTGDSAFVAADESDVRRIGGAPGVERLRKEARVRGKEIARAWTRADPKSGIAWVQLGQSYFVDNQADSAVAILSEALRRPLIGGPTVRMAILTFQQTTADTGAATTVRYILDHFTPDSMREVVRSQRLAAEGDLMSQAAAAIGRAADVTAAAKLFTATDSFLPGTTTPTRYLTDGAQISLGLAMGEPMSDRARQTILGMIHGVDALPPAIAGEARRGSLSIPYLAFLASRDTTFSAAAQRWAGKEYPELTALTALAHGDTVTARKLALTFTLPDSLRNARFAMGGLRSSARAEVLESLGLLRQAAETYEATEPDRFNKESLVEPGYAVWVRTFLARARLWKALGERDKAAAAYEEFIRRWANADGAAGKLVTSAKIELGQLRDAPRKQ